MAVGQQIMWMRFFIVSMWLSSLLAAVDRAVADLLLIGAVEFSTDDTGASAGGQVWNTRGGDAIFNLYLSQTGSNGQIINPGDDSSTSLNVALSPGSHTFYMFGEPGLVRDYFGLNLFFDAESTNPGISVFASTDTSPSPPFPSFAANSSMSTRTVANSLIPGSGSLVFSNGTFTATLTDYRWSEPTVEALDRIQSRNSLMNGNDDFVGQFTLEVDAIPEPSSIALLATVSIGMWGFSWRQWLTRTARQRSLP